MATSSNFSGSSQQTDSWKNKLEKFMDWSRDLVPAPFRFIVLTLVIISVWAMLFFFPATKYPSGSLYPPCPFHALTGFHCAGCGSLRTLSCVAQGDLKEAWKKNKLTVLCLPYLFWAYLSYGASCFGLKFPRFFIKGRWIYGFLVVVILFWILRNIPYYPFSVLAPH